MLPRHHAGHRGLVAPYDAVEIGLQHALPFLRRHGVGRRARLHRSGANKAVDVAEFLFDPAEHLEHGVAVAHVELAHGDAWLFHRELLQAGRIDIAGHHARADGSRAKRQGAADAVGAAGHDDHVAGRVKAHLHDATVAVDRKISIEIS
jgi:hypothetical protein